MIRGRLHIAVYYGTSVLPARAFSGIWLGPQDHALAELTGPGNDPSVCSLCSCLEPVKSFSRLLVQLIPNISDFVRKKVLLL